MNWTLLPVPICVLTDAYKASHFLMYPKSESMVAYGEFRKGFKNSPDNRIIFYGARYIVQRYLLHRWTEEEVELASKFFITQNAGFKELVFPKNLFLKFIKENDGYFPVKLETLPEGTIVYPHVPVYQITCKGEYSPLVTYLETILNQIWYPCSVATLSRKIKDIIRSAFELSDDEDKFFLIDSRLHDFGFRGCTSLEQSIIGGVSHLLNFIGSDTMSATYFAQYHLNDGVPVGGGIPASEHSVMISWDSELDAIKLIIDKFAKPGSIFSIVIDSYDYNKVLEYYLPLICEQIKASGATLVIRPDSGDNVQTVLDALRLGEKSFGAVTNSKGYKVLNNMAIIQGNSINLQSVESILEAVNLHGYAASNVAFGMGSELLQSVSRDTMSFVIKLSHVKHPDGIESDVMKCPQYDAEKASLPGMMVVKRVNNVPTTFPIDCSDQVEGDNLLQVVYDCRPVPNAFSEKFDVIKERIEKEWNLAPTNYDALSQAMKDKLVSNIKNCRDK